MGATAIIANNALSLAQGKPPQSRSTLVEKIWKLDQDKRLHLPLRFARPLRVPHFTHLPTKR